VVFLSYGGLTMSKTIIHLSDLHIKDSQCDEVKYFKKICQIIKNIYKDIADDTLIIITGDIVDGAKKEQFKIVGPLIDLLDQDGLTVWPLPGNHDYAPDGIIGNAKTAKRNRGDLYHSYKFVYTEKYIDEFSKNIIKNRKLNEICNFSYPQILSLNNPKIWLFGLNSTNIEEIDFKGGQGGIGNAQMNFLEEELNKVLTDNSDATILLLLHHHPFKLDNVSDDLWHQLVNGDALMRVIKNKIDVLFFGHENWHFYNKFGKINGIDCGIPHILSCSNTTDAKGRKMTVTSDGLINWKKPEMRGLFGWEIEIENKENIWIKMLQFDLTNNNIIKTEV
jgi:predicted MPP superfamily phosphohydrolase